MAVSCKKDPPAAEPEPGVKRVVIGNIGVYPDGASSISEYNPNTNTIEHNLYRKANVNIPGSLVTDILIDGNNMFLVMNGSENIIVVDKNTYELKYNIKNLGNPRRIVKVATDKFYVTDYTSNAVLVLDMATRKVVKTLDVGDSPDRMFVHDDLTFVCNTGSVNRDSTLTIIRNTADTIVKKLNVGDTPNSIVKDRDDNMFVLCSGYSTPSDPTATTYSQIRKFNLDSLTMAIDSNEVLAAIDTVVFEDILIRGCDLQISADGEYLYYLGNNNPNGNGHGLFRAPTETLKIPASPFVTGTFYTLSYDDINDDLYTADALAGEFPATVTRYKASDGSVKSAFTAGIYPRPIAFKK